MGLGTASTEHATLILIRRFIVLFEAVNCMRGLLRYYIFVSWVRASVQSEKCFWSFVHHFIRIPYTIRMSHIKPSVYIDLITVDFDGLIFLYEKKEIILVPVPGTPELFFAFHIKNSIFFCILFYPKIKSNRYCPHVSLY